MQINESRPLVVLVSHSEQLLASGIRASLKGQSGMLVLERLPDPGGPEVDIVIADHAEGVRLCSIDSASRSPHLRAARVLIVSGSDQERAVRVALECGVFGYLLSNSAVEELLNAIWAIMLRRRYLSLSVSQRIAASLSRESLTDREREVLEHLARGDCNKDIARHLGIALGTAKAHVKGIMDKLEANSRTHAVSIATERGLVASSPRATMEGMDHVLAARGFSSLHSQDHWKSQLAFS